MKLTATRRLLCAIVAMVLCFAAAFCFADSVAAAEAQWVKVTEAPADWSGTYLVVYENEGEALILDSSLETIDAVENYKTAAISENAIAGDYSAYAVTIEAMEGGYSLKAANGQYIGQTANANKLPTNAAPILNTITMDEAEGVLIAGEAGAVLRFNAASNQMRFRYYKSTSFTSQKAIALYKLAEEETPVEPPVDPVDPPVEECKHENAEYVEATKATCDQAGNYAYYYCADCSRYFEDEALTVELFFPEDIAILATGHTRIEKVEAVLPTCTVAGNYEYWWCSACSRYFSDRTAIEELHFPEDIVILALGHQRPEKIEAVRATCDQPGNIEYYLCGACGAYLLKDDEAQEWVEVTREDILILPMGHERIEKIEAVRPTCDVAGNIEYYWCSACSKYFADRAATEELFFPDDIVILPLGHERIEKVEAVEPTHTVAGNHSYYWCSACSRYFADRTAQEELKYPEDIVVAPMGHIRAEYVEAKPATCTEFGTAGYYYCPVCDAMFEGRAPEAAELTAADIQLYPLGHERIEKIEAVRPTCDVAGNVEYWYCSACSKYFSERAAQNELSFPEDIVILALGHERIEKIEAVRPTCDVAGNVEYWYCSACSRYFTDRTATEELTFPEDIVILPLGHERIEKIEAQKPTCDVAGNIEYWYCSVCSRYFTDKTAQEELSFLDIVILPLGHERIEKIEAVRPTCDVAGNVEYWYCSACSRYFTDRTAQEELFFPEDIVILPLGHERIEKIEAVRPTCDQAGNIEYWYCSACSRYFADRAATEELHFPEDIAILPLGHERIEKIEAVRPTCDQAGNIEYWYCSACSRYFADRAATEELYFPEDIAILPLGHERIEKIEAVQATHTTAGNIEYWYCSVCSRYFADRAATEELTFPEDIVVLPMGHIRAEYVEAVDPTCFAYGNIAYWYCADCDAKFESRDPNAKEIKYYVLDIVPHESVEYIPAVRPTCDVAGSWDYYYCWDCSRYFADEACTEELFFPEDIIVLPLGHERLEKIEAVRPTCDQAGNIEYWYCSVCSRYFADKACTEELFFPEDVVILPLGHERIEKIEAVKPTCDQAGNIEYWYCSACSRYFADRAATEELFFPQDIVVLPIGHERIEKVEAVKATHTVAGNIEYWYCSACSRYFADRAATEELFFPEDIVVAPMGHIRAEYVEAVDPTCELTGNIAYWYCAECDAKFESRDPAAKEIKYTVLAKIPHAIEHIEAVRPTCDVAGNVEYYWCSTCSRYFADAAATEELFFPQDIVVLPMGHERIEKIEAVRPTCDQAGNIEYWYCSACSRYFADRAATEELFFPEDIVVLPIGHERIEKVEAVRPTCDQAGNIEYYWCSACSRYFADRAATEELHFPEDIVILPLGHERIEKIEAVRPTCDQAGNIEYWFCSVCSRYFTDRTAQEELFFPEDIVVLPLGHERIMKVEAIRPTCDRAGNIEYWYCEACSRYFTDRTAQEELFFPEDIVVLPIGHERIEKVEAVRPTCDQAGNIEYYWCSACSRYFADRAATEELFFPEDIVVLPIGHERIEKVEAVRPTCDQAGNIEYYWCSACSRYFADRAATEELFFPEDIVVLPIGHERIELVEAVKPSCDQAGNIEYYWCSACSRYFADRAATEELFFPEDIVVLPIGHERIELVEAVAPTALQAGNVEYWYCSECSRYFADRAATEELFFPQDIVVPVLERGLAINPETGLMSYYENGALVTGRMTLIEVDGKIYWLCYSGKIKTDAKQTIQPDQTNGLNVRPGTYYFNEDGTIDLESGFNFFD